MAVNQIQEDVLNKEFENVLFAKNEFISTQLSNLYLLTVNHKTAPVAIREKFAIPEYRLEEAVQNLKTFKSIQSFLILSTCNRTEIYFKTDDFNNALGDIYKFFTNYLGLEEKIAKEYSTILQEHNVINHAYKVAAGLDSLVLGESQVLSQVKVAYSTAQKALILGNTLEILFQNVIKTAKEVHKSTSLSKNCQSISSAAIDLADKICGPLKTKQIMVLGAGKMAELALEHIVKLGGSKETVVLNRSPHRIIEFSDNYKIDSSIPFENVYDAMNDVDIVIAATGAPHFILFADQFTNLRKNSNKPLFILDISMPRNVDSEFGQLPNVKLMDIDSLQLIYSQTTHTNNEDLKQAESIILNHIKDFYRQISKEVVSSLIKELKDKVDKIRLTKLEQFTSGKTTFTLEEIDYITKNIVSTILHLPINSLKNSSTYGTENKKIEIIRELFDL